MENNQNIREILNLILTLQKSSCCNETPCEGCTKPFLGPSGNIICYNTRPITLYSCCTGTIWTMPYTLNGETGNSTIFRIENIEGDCATFRVLLATVVDDVTTYTLTNSYFTIDLSCVLAIQCLPDVFAA